MSRDQVKRPTAAGRARRFDEIVARRVRDTAYHEAAHAVVGWHVAECDFKRITIASAADRAEGFRAELEGREATLDRLGVVEFYSKKALPAVPLPAPEIPEAEWAKVIAAHKRHCRHAIMVSVAGRLAERRSWFESGEEEDRLGDAWWGEQGWDDPHQALNELAETADEPGADYAQALDYARALAGEDERRTEIELRRCIRRVTRLLSLPTTWRAVQRIAAELEAHEELSQQAALAICLAERVPFASSVPSHDRQTCRLLATEDTED